MERPMEKIIFESMSAAMDDEADSYEVKQLFNGMNHDSELRETWTRFHKYSAILRGDEVAKTSSTRDWKKLADEYSKVIDLDEGIPKAAIISIRPRLKRAQKSWYAAGGAIAASFVLGSLWFVVPAQEFDQGSMPGIASDTTKESMQSATAQSTIPNSATRSTPTNRSQSTPPPQDFQTVSSRRSLSQEQMEERVKKYIVDHARNPTVTTPNPVGLVRVSSTTNANPRN